MALVQIQGTVLHNLAQAELIFSLTLFNLRTEHTREIAVQSSLQRRGAGTASAGSVARVFLYYLIFRIFVWFGWFLSEECVSIHNIIGGSVLSVRCMGIASLLPLPQLRETD